MHSKDKGDMAEAFVIANCLKNGWSVSKTVGDNQKYDIIVDKKDGKLLRVQVKWGRYIAKQGVVYIEARSCGYKFVDGQRILFSDNYHNQIDSIASYCPETNKCYLFEHNNINRVYTLRVNIAKGYQKNNINIRYAKDYEI